jgi:type VI secretion system protein ImpF
MEHTSNKDISNNLLLHNFYGADQESIQKTIHNNLQILLETRSLGITNEEKLSQAERSVLTFGLPDFANMSFSNPQAQLELCQTIKSRIKIFEPRLTNVQVSILNNDQVIERSLKIRIDAMVRSMKQVTSFELEVK